MATTTPCGRFPFDLAFRSDKPEKWGVWDKRHQRWAEPPAFDEDTAQLVTVLMIEAYAAGFADAMIEKARSPRTG
jgi:hypothetical protein